MKTIDISLTPIQAVMLARILNLSMDGSLTESVLENLRGENGGRTDIYNASEEEFNDYTSKSIYGKLISALAYHAINHNQFTPKAEVPELFL